MEAIATPGEYFKVQIDFRRRTNFDACGLADNAHA